MSPYLPLTVDTRSHQGEVSGASSPMFGGRLHRRRRRLS